MKPPQKLSSSNRNLNNLFMTKSVENIIDNLKISENNDKKEITVKKDEEEEEYEYDVPENNKPLISNNNSLLSKQQAIVTTSLSNNELTISTNDKIGSLANDMKHSSTSFSPKKVSTTPAITRKSNSPTIDSGISSSSLVSLNDLLNANANEQQQTQSLLDPRTKIPVNEKIDQIEMRFTKIIKNLRETCKILLEIQQHTRWRERSNLEKNLMRIKQSFLEIKTLLNDFYDLCIVVKNTYLANNSLTNKENYNELCYKLNDFQQKFNSNINILNTLNWDIRILASNNTNRNNMIDELDENLLRLNYLIELINIFNEFNYQYNVFSKNAKAPNDLPTLRQQPATTENDFSDAIDDSEDDIYENDDEEWLKPRNCNENFKNETNLSDKMLVKFYSKHIDDNFNDIKDLHELINCSLTRNSDNDVQTMELTNKLALSGHKLVFICDTLNKNLINMSLKASLNSLSNNLCDCLKLYVIRIKTCYSNSNQQIGDKSNLLVVDSLRQVFNCAQELKQLIIKYL